MSFLDRIRQTIARYDMLQAGDSVGVAVSGGADSVCLLHVLLELRSEFGLQLAVIHVDHQLRGTESQADAQFVHHAAQQLGLPFHLRTLELDPAQGNLEQSARNARYAFFRDLIRDGAAQKVATGHTRSDQAETVLYRLLRGAGSAGLAGVRPVSGSGVFRPLIEVTRPQIEVWLKDRAIEWRQDSTNAALRFDRNRIRHQLLPMLEAEWNPEIRETLAQTADWAQEEEHYWRLQLRQLAENWVRFERSSAVLDVVHFNSLPIAVTRRLIREIVQRVKGDLLGVSFAHIEAVRKLAGAPRGEGRQQIPGLEVLRSFNWLRFVKPSNGGEGTGQDWHLSVTVPGRYTLPCYEYVVPPTTIELELIRNDGVYNGSSGALDGQWVCGPLVLRNWRVGDQYRRHGHAGVEKIKKLFQEYRIPLWERQNWPIITVGSRIAWASQFGPAAEFAVDANSRTVLRINEFRETYEAEEG